MATKEKRKSTLQLRVAHGTPSHMDDTKTYALPGQATKFLLNRIAEHQEWADRYNRACAEELGKIRTEVSELNPRGMHVGEVRAWQATDDHTGVIFRFEIEMVSR